MDNPEPFIQEEPLVYCPRCRQKTDNLTSQEIPVVVFFGVGYAWNYERVVGCRRCSCKHIGFRLLQSIVFSNFFFPLTGSVYLFVWLNTVCGGNEVHGD